jgi:hypothetical protein
MHHKLKLGALIFTLLLLISAGCWTVRQFFQATPFQSQKATANSVLQVFDQNNQPLSNVLISWKIAGTPDINSGLTSTDGKLHITQGSGYILNIVDLKKDGYVNVTTNFVGYSIGMTPDRAVDYTDSHPDVFHLEKIPKDGYGPLITHFTRQIQIPGDGTVVKINLLDDNASGPPTSDCDLLISANVGSDLDQYFRCDWAVHAGAPTGGFIEIPTNAPVYLVVPESGYQPDLQFDRKRPPDGPDFWSPMFERRCYLKSRKGSVYFCGVLSFHLNPKEKVILCTLQGTLSPTGTRNMFSLPDKSNVFADCSSCRKNALAIVTTMPSDP